MPDRYLVQERTEIGVETTPGTAVPSTVKLNGLQIDIDTALELDRFGPAGNLFDTIAAPRQEWATGALSGFPTYTELPYVFSNVFGAAVVTTPTGSGAALTRDWNWAPSSNTPWVPKTWTIRRGMAGNTAEMARYGLLSGVNMSFSRTAVPTIGGALFAFALDYLAAVQSTGLLSPAVVPVLAGDVCVYLDPTAAEIGTTRLTRDFMASFELTELFAPFWPLDCTLDSFGGHAPLKPGTAAALQLGNDTQGRELATAMREGSTRFLRIEANGPVIEAAYTHRLRIDAAIKVVDAPTRGDSDGLSTLEWGFGIFDDPSFGALKIGVRTNIATI